MDKTAKPEMIDNHRRARINDCRIISLNRNHHANGNLTAVNNGDELPFDVLRTFYIYDVPGGAERGGHSHHMSQQFIIAISGSFDVTVDDGQDQFTSGSVCLVLNSHHYDEADYVRDYNKFLELKRESLE